MLARAERLDHAYLRNTSGLTALAGGRLWLRQADRGLEPDGRGDPVRPSGFGESAARRRRVRASR